jgi:dipeptidyl-peptidase-4
LLEEFINSFIHPDFSIVLKTRTLVMNRNIALLSLILCTLVNSLFAQSLTLEELWASSRFAAKKAPGFQSMRDGLHYSNTFESATGKGIVRYTFAEGKAKDTLLYPDEASFDGSIIQFNEYFFSGDEKFILLTAAPEMIYRHSMKADGYLFDLSTRKISKLSQKGKFMTPEFSPEGKSMSFIRENNLFIVDLTTMKEIQVTTDGKRNEIINGAVDWVYEEEFSKYKGFDWSPDGKKIVYYRFDESEVKEFNLTTYGTLYPAESTYKYPKAGEKNSKVTAHVYDLTTGKNILLKTGEEWEYLPRINWTMDPMQVSVQRMNRHQNILELIFCNAETGEAKVILRDTNSTFIEITDDLTFLKDGKRFIWSSSRDGYRHIYLYGIDGKLIKQITSGSYDVMQYYGFDEKTSEFFYQSAEPTALERRIVSMNIAGKKKILSSGDGVHEAEFSSGFNYFADTYSTLTTPFTSALYNREGKLVRVLEDNASLRKLLSTYNLGKTDTFSIYTIDTTELRAWKIVPPDFNPSKKYPVLLYLYGGPGRQTVMNEWGGTQQLWHQMLAQKGYVVISVDNRGTPGRGLEFANCIYKDMGGPEVRDQVEVAQWIKKQSWADTARVGVWGWSFGGYMSSLLMTKTPGVFKAGIAVAPVTNWRYYDNIYTERYLQTPQENAKGYDENSPINFAKDLQGSFLLVHGSGDDNVHYQNTMEFVNALVKSNKKFDLMIYPNRNHGIYGGGARLHLFSLMTDFIEKNL